MNSSGMQQKTDGHLPPASAAKREAIVCAAARVFMAFGYGNASMDQIASEAGVSKQTVYSHFGAKDALFEEIVKSKCQELMGEGGPLGGPVGDLEAVLVTTATRFLDVILSDESITLYRTILAESARFPELAEAFYRSGPRAATARMADFLDRAVAAGAFHSDDTKASAELFFAMFRDHLYMGRLLSVCDKPGDDEIAQHARRVVRAFLRAHRP